MMRNISPSLNLYRNIKYDLRAYNKLGLTYSKAISFSSIRNYTGLTKQHNFNFSTNSDVEVETAKLIVPFKGYLTIRNS